MPNKIQIKRGLKSAMPTGASGEPLFATDTRELFIGTSNGNVNMSGSHWYMGTDMASASVTQEYSYSSCPEVKLGDIYMNTSNGYIYACTTAGKGTNAKWKYQGCIKGNAGAAGSNGKGISSAVVTYAAAISGTTAPSSWQSTIPSVAAGNYLWTRLVITYTDGTTSTSYSVACQGKDGATYVVRTQAELRNAINAMPSSGGKIILREGSFAVEGGHMTQDPDYDDTFYVPGIIGAKSIIFIGQGNQTSISISGRFSGYKSGSTPEEKYNNVLTFKDAKIIPRDTGGGAIWESRFTDFNFENCDFNLTSRDIGQEYLVCRDLTMASCRVEMSALGIVQSDEPNYYLGCTSGFDVFGQLNVDKCNIVIENNNSDEDYECNLFYNRNGRTLVGQTQGNKTTGTISNCHISCKGVGKTNILNYGNINMIGNTIVLENNKASIHHYNDDVVPTAAFIGNHVEYYGTYMRFAVVTGNTFDHKAAGTTTANKMILLCPTNMTGNHFVGSAAYIDGQNKKHIIDRNLSDNGITVGSAASGSVTTNNVQY